MSLPTWSQTCFSHDAGVIARLRQWTQRLRLELPISGLVRIVKALDKLVSRTERAHTGDQDGGRQPLARVVWPTSMM
jgi:hypothetical protein